MPSRRKAGLLAVHKRLIERLLRDELEHRTFHAQKLRARLSGSGMTQSAWERQRPGWERWLAQNPRRVALIEDALVRLRAEERPRGRKRTAAGAAGGKRL